MKIAFVIQHHPSRADRLPALLAAIPEATVVTDPEPDSRASWPAARLAWQTYPEDATHVVVLEDDAVPCEGFVSAVTLALYERPAHAVAFWANRKQIADALAFGKAWQWCHPMVSYHGTVCNALPTSWVRSFVSWGDLERYDRRKPGGVDQRLREWLVGRGGRVLLSAPCLVQHGLPEDSLLWPNGGQLPIKRVTTCFADDLGINAVDWDWRAGDG